MKILFFTIGNEQVASSRTRVYQYLPYLKQAGIIYKVITYTAPWQSRKVINMQNQSLIGKLLGKFYSFLKAIEFIVIAPSYDFLFIQRVLLPEKVQMFLKKINNNIIFDFDDAIYLCDRPGGNKFQLRLNRLLKDSKCIILENDYNKEYAHKFNKNILIITGPIDIKRYSLRQGIKADDKVVLGWIGSPSTAHYLKPLYTVFEALAKKYNNLVVKLIGVADFPQLKGVEVRIKKWALETEVSELQDFDIGLMPLPEDKWAMGKGGYKLLQYMALGIPSVASGVGVNKRIIEEGVNGFLADSPDAWLEKMSYLVENGRVREIIGKKARMIAERVYSYEANAPRLIGRLESIRSC